MVLLWMGSCRNISTNQLRLISLILFLFHSSSVKKSGQPSSMDPLQTESQNILMEMKFPAPGSVQPFKGFKRDTIGIRGGPKCQIRNVHPAALRLQKRAQPNSDAHRAVLRSAGATGAVSRASP